MTMYKNEAHGFYSVGLLLVSNFAEKIIGVTWDV
ncbi:MAG: hypothetical protein G01um101448_618, partial [Parcubacteria group bacterium Gr01-1014_48]